MLQSIIFICVLLISVGIRWMLYRRRKRDQNQINQNTNQNPNAGLPWVYKQLENHRVDAIVKNYRKQANKEKNEVDRLNWLGLAYLYNHEADDAIEHFQQALNGAVGEDENIMRDNLACAYLQKGWYQPAMELMDQARRAGSFMILTYVFTLLMNGQRDEAREFYKLHPTTSGAHSSMETLFEFDPRKPETLEAVRKVVDNPHMWLYLPFLPELFDRWDIEVFFNKTNRNEILFEQCQYLIEQLTEDMFASPLVRYIRGTLVAVSDKVRDYEGSTQLYGLFHGLDELSNEMPVAQDLKHECKIFWQRIYYSINGTFNPNQFHVQEAEDWMKAQLPTDAKKYPTQSERCELYFIPSVQRGVRILRQFDPYPRIYAEFISPADTEETWRKMQPFVDVLNEDATLDHVLDPLIFSFVYDVHQVSEDTIHDTVIRLPNKYRFILEQPGHEDSAVQKPAGNLES